MARDADGFRSAWCRSYQGITDPLIIEALALRDAVVAAHNQNFEKIIAETDCAELVGLWLERRNHRALINPIISEIGEVIGKFTSFELVHIQRTANTVAHDCAKFACVHSAPADWVVESPPCLSYSLMADCNSGYPVKM